MATKYNKMYKMMDRKNEWEKKRMKINEESFLKCKTCHDWVAMNAK